MKEIELHILKEAINGEQSIDIDSKEQLKDLLQDFIKSDDFGENLYLDFTLRIVYRNKNISDEDIENIGMQIDNNFSQEKDFEFHTHRRTFVPLNMNALPFSPEDITKHRIADDGYKFIEHNIYSILIKGYFILSIIIKI